MYRIRPYHKLLRNKSNDTGCFLNQLHNLFPCILVGFSQFFFRVVVRDVFQTEHPDREIFTPQLFPVGDLFIKDIFNLHRCQFAYLIIFVQRQHISLFNNLAAEQAECLGKKEKHNQQNRNTRYKTATGQYSFYNSFKNLLHTF